jgi:hypothetical protein
MLAYSHFYIKRRFLGVPPSHCHDDDTGLSRRPCIALKSPSKWHIDARRHAMYTSVRTSGTPLHSTALSFQAIRTTVSHCVYRMGTCETLEIEHTRRAIMSKASSILTDLRKSKGISRTELSLYLVQTTADETKWSPELLRHLEDGRTPLKLSPHLEELKAACQEGTPIFTADEIDSLAQAVNED